jgi:hypothetical protein
VLDEIRRSLLRVPLEHAFSIYRIYGSASGVVREDLAL